MNQKSTSATTSKSKARPKTTRLPRGKALTAARRPKSRPDVFVLYERAVQSPVLHVELFHQMYSTVRPGKKARGLREDFCGTFAISCAWVASEEGNTAVGVDLDGPTLESGRKRNLSLLTSSQQARVQILQANVLEVKPKAADVLAVCNFSFYIFKQRRLLLDYFRACLRGLAKDGVLVLEMSGGPGMVETTRDHKRIRRKDMQPYQYTWDQKSFDPITNEAHYAIHFRMADGTVIRDAFTYDWRLWTIPEVLELLEEAGFSKSVVFWEKEIDGEGTGEYVPTEKGTNDYSWCAYIAGLR